MADLRTKERQRRSRQLALFNSYRALFAKADQQTIKKGLSWYSTANKLAQHLASESTHDLSTAAGVITVLSPGTRWEDNLKAAWGALRGDWDMAWSYHAYGSNGIDKAKHIVRQQLSEQELHSYINTPDAHKTPEFYRSIMLQDDATCVDSWIYRINRAGYKSSSPPIGFVRSSQAAIRMLASQKQCKPYQMQAILWLQIRKEQGQRSYNSSQFVSKLTENDV